MNNEFLGLVTLNIRGVEATVRVRWTSEYALPGVWMRNGKFLSKGFLDLFNKGHEGEAEVTKAAVIARVAQMVTGKRQLLNGEKLIPMTQQETELHWGEGRKKVVEKVDQAAYVLLQDRLGELRACLDKVNAVIKDSKKSKLAKDIELIFKEAKVLG